MIGWENAWNKIIRNVIFKDSELKQLMKIPSNTGILQFIDKYFIRAGYTSELLSNEACRIVYSDTLAGDTQVPAVKKNIITFDIYVKNEDLHNVGQDRLVFRTSLITERLFYLLTKDRYVADTGYRFWPAGEWDFGTRTIGYSRHTVSFYYMRVY